MSKESINQTKLLGKSSVNRRTYITVLVITLVTIVMVAIVALILIPKYQQDEELRNVTNMRTSLARVAASLKDAQPNGEWSDKSRCYKADPPYFQLKDTYHCEARYAMKLEGVSRDQADMLITAGTVGSDVKGITDFHKGEMYKDAGDTVYPNSFLLKGVEIRQGTCSLSYRYNSDGHYITGMLLCENPVSLSTYDKLTAAYVLLP